MPTTPTRSAAAAPTTSAEPPLALDVVPKRSRRALLAGAVGGIGALAATVIGGAARVQAAAGDALILGSTSNSAGTSNTSLSTSSSGTALLVTQNGSGTALRGSAVGAGSIAGFFTANNGTGISGVTGNATSYGVYGANDGAAGSGAAIRASGKNNHGLVATTNAGGANAVSATNAGVGGGAGSAVFAYAEGNCTGVVGRATSGNGLFGFSVSSAGVYGSSTNATGVQGGGSPGVFGSSTNQFGTGVEGLGYGTSGHGVVGTITQNSITASGVYGASAGASSYAGYFEGHVGVTGTLSKGGGSFRIDHPLDPANKILQHSFVESPDMMNLYNGLVTADANGEATVELPAWFKALNRDFRYGLTPMGEFAPLYVKSKVKDGRFTIAGARPGQEVSWQLTGIRADAWANANRIPVEFAKSGDQRGRYLHPLEHGQPESAGVDYPMRRRLAALRDETEEAAAAGHASAG